MRNKIIAITFAVLIAGTTLLNLFTAENGFSERENRYLAKRPAITRKGLLDGSFTEDFEKYVSDQFPFRDSFITVNVMTERLSGKKDSNGVYFGKDGYLLEKVDSVEEGQLEKNTETLIAFFTKLGEMDITATAMIVPTAPFVLQDKLPPFATQYDQQKIFDSLQSLLGEDFVDTYPILYGKKEEGIYYKTDHHWTTEGAFYAYQAFCEARGLSVPQRQDYVVETVAEDFFGTVYTKTPLPFMQADSIKRFVADGNVSVIYNNETTADSLYLESALASRDQYRYFLGGNNAITEITTGNQNGKHLLVLKDSFAHCFVPFLTRDFETITMLDYRYYHGSTETLIKEGGMTDVLVLYNAVNFAEDKDLYQMGK